MSDPEVDMLPQLLTRRNPVVKVEGRANGSAGAGGAEGEPGRAGVVEAVA